MTPEDAIGALTYTNQIDPRVQLTEANTETWTYALKDFDARQVRWVIRDYYATADKPAAMTPGIIRQRVRTLQGQADAKRNAIEATPPARNPNSWRTRNPEEWDRLVAEGRDQRRTELRSRGIEPWGARQEDTSATE